MGLMDYLRGSREGAGFKAPRTGERPAEATVESKETEGVIPVTGGEIRLSSDLGYLVVTGLPKDHPGYKPQYDEFRVIEINVPDPSRKSGYSPVAHSEDFDYEYDSSPYGTTFDGKVEVAGPYGGNVFIVYVDKLHRRDTPPEA